MQKGKYLHHQIATAKVVQGMARTFLVPALGRYAPLVQLLVGQVGDGHFERNGDSLTPHRCWGGGQRRVRQSIPAISSHSPIIVRFPVYHRAVYATRARPLAVVADHHDVCPTFSLHGSRLVPAPAHLQSFAGKRGTRIKREDCVVGDGVHVKTQQE
jgi:hypothetical protein